MNTQGYFYKQDHNDPYWRVTLPDTIPHLHVGKDDGTVFYGTNTKEKLRKEYPHILNSIEEEGYYIPDNQTAYYFFEIPGKTDDDIIGFATFNIHDHQTIVLNQIYIQPEYRNGQQFYKLLNYFMDLLEEATIYIQNPNKNILDKLDEVDALIQLTPRFYISKYAFIYDLVAYEDTLKHTNKTYHQTKGETTTQIRTNLYDKQLNALVNLTTKNDKAYTGREKANTKRASMSLIRDEDQQQTNYLEKRRQDPWIQKGKYFKKTRKIVTKKLREKGFTI